MRRLRITLGLGLVVGVTALALTLSQAPITVARVSTSEHRLLGQDIYRERVCQANETLPRATSAIRLRIFAFLGPKVGVEALQDGRVIAHGQHGAGWTGHVVTAPVAPLSVTRSGVELCFTLYLNGDETAEMAGERTSEALAAHSETGALRGRVRVEYLTPGPSSWWSLAPSVARRMGLGHAASGTWSVLLVILAMGGVAVVCSRLLLRELT